MSEALPERDHPARRLAASWATGLIVLGLLVLLVLRQGDPRELARLLTEAHAPWVVLAVLLQLGTYACLAVAWRAVLRRAGRPLRLRPLVGLALAKLFTDQAVPTGGVAGSVVVVRGLMRRGLPRGPAAATILVDLLGNYVAFTSLLGGALLFLSVNHDLPGVVLGMAAAFLLAALSIPGGILWLNHHRRAPWWVRRLPGIRSIVGAIFDAPPDLLRDRRLLLWVTGLKGAIMLLDAATLGVMLAAVGAPGHPSEVWAAYMVAFLAQTVGVVPGGLGTFEGASVAILHSLGWQLEAAFAATLLSRALSFWLPMLPGLAAARLELRRTPRSG